MQGGWRRSGMDLMRLCSFCCRHPRLPESCMVDVVGSVPPSLDVRTPFNTNFHRWCTDRGLPIIDQGLTRVTTGNPRLGVLDLSAEILEDVILLFHAQDILRLRIVMWFLLLVRFPTPNVNSIFTPVPFHTLLAEPRISRPHRLLPSCPIPHGPFSSCVGR